MKFKSYVLLIITLSGPFVYRLQGMEPGKRETRAEKIKRLEKVLVDAKKKEVRWQKLFDMDHAKKRMSEKEKREFRKLNKIIDQVKNDIKNITYRLSKFGSGEKIKPVKAVKKQKKSVVLEPLPVDLVWGETGKRIKVKSSDGAELFIYLDNIALKSGFLRDILEENYEKDTEIPVPFEEELLVRVFRLMQVKPELKMLEEEQIQRIVGVLDFNMIARLLDVANYLNLPDIIEFLAVRFLKEVVPFEKTKEKFTVFTGLFSHIQAKMYEVYPQVSKKLMNLRGAYEVAYGKKLTDEEFEKIESEVLKYVEKLDLSDMRLGNQGIKFLSKCVNLVELNLSGGKISDISILEGLSKLRVLDLSRNSLYDIGPLGKLVNLENLILIDNYLSDISALGNCIGLRFLSLGSWYYTPRTGSLFRDISPLKQCKNLERLVLISSYVSDIKPLTSLSKLRELDVRYSIELSAESKNLLKDMEKNGIDVNYNY